MATLYDYALSGNCYKVRLLAALLEVPLDVQAVDFYPGRAHLAPAFLALNPAGTLPVLETGESVLTQSSAILGWLAATQDPTGRWLPTDEPETLARVLGWLAFADRLTATVGEARLHDMLRKPLDIDAARAGAKQVLRQLETALAERQIAGQSFLAAPHPTIADIACFPYAALAPDGGIALDPYPAIRDWIFAIRSLPGFITMPGIHALHEVLDQP
ncbi:glutathione S-transferase family protein [Mesobacterium pallidum]|uniref:glutathione S-transferase family protein n=1 Tax=Mesobacterium pallidum TaxID=2872037 RepID=UPI001EE34B92|nr:glutathione S-transferase family protein [Mesobacterium pallidum]